MSTTYNRVHYDRDRMRSCIYGLAAGDALGVPYEFCGRDTFECTGMADGGADGQPAGTWSDDTSMTLCICAGIKRLGTIDTADIAYRFRQWLEHGAIAGVYYGFGAIPPKWISRLRGKAVIDQCIWKGDR